jgi:hypothetical protein
MKKPTCPLEDQVRQCLTRGGGDPGLRDHAAGCPVCRDILAVSDWMLRFRDLTLERVKVDELYPASGKLWDLARAGRSIDLVAARRVLKPLTLYRKIAWLVSVAGGAALALQEFERIKSLLALIPGLDALAATLRRAAEPGAASPAQQAVLPAALGLAGILVIILVTGIRRADAG